MWRGIPGPPRTEVKVKNARIIAVKNRENGVELAGEKTPAVSHTAGLGNMSGQADKMSKLHYPWGEPLLNQAQVLKGKITLYRYPDSRSQLKVSREGNNQVKAKWTGLTDSRTFYPKDYIEFCFAEDDCGALSIRGKGFTEMKGVFGLQIPIENLDGSGRLYLASFGGLEYPAGGKKALIGYQSTSLFYEAGFMAYRLKNTALGYWSEDPHFRPFFIMIGREENASCFGMEINTIMPFEQRNRVETPVIKIDSFADSGWVAAARPYRNWYRKQFARQIAARDSIPWANEINAIMDTGIPSEETLARIKQIMPAQRVLLHVWEARKPPFDKELPDYSLRKGYPEAVRRAHEHGFKVMCYVCSLCANYRSPVWDRDRLADFFLTRINDITNYNGSKSVFDEMKTGTLNRPDGTNRFAGIKPGRLIYCDPLSKGWRNYFTGQVVRMNQAGGTDANYQDTLGCTSDNGNGVIDGLAGGEGNAALAQDLAKAMPKTPMAAEYGPAAIGFAVKWPLNGATSWGSDRFRSYRIHHQIPLAAFLFGYRPWISIHRADNDFKQHLVAACSDQLGGLGMFTAAKDMNTESGFADHLVLRSKLFTEKQLVPWFPEKKYPENIRCMYQDAQKRIYRYYDDGRLQMMLGPDGKPLYGRIDHVRSIQINGLVLPGWPASDENGIYGLNPKNSYALFPGKIEPEINLGKLPDGVTVKYYYSQPHYAYLELAGKGKFSSEINLPPRFKNVYVNDRRINGRTISGTLPLRVFFSDGNAVACSHLLRLDDSRGLQYGKPLSLPKARHFSKGRPLYHMGYYDSLVMDSVFKVENEDDAFEVLFRNMQNKYGNGAVISAYINGLKVAEFDCYTRLKRKNKKGSAGIFDTKLRKWIVPLGKYQGAAVLVSIRVAKKNSSNSDMMYSSIPRLIRSKERKPVTEFPSPADPVRKRK